MSNSAIILAGGRGKRMQANISKQYILLKGKPILYYTLKTFIDCPYIDEIVLVVPEDEIEYCIENIIDKYGLKVDKIVAGGNERQDSVYNGLKGLKNNGIVLIHDGARPFASERIIEDGIKYAATYGAAAPGVIPKDTIKIKKKDNFSKETPERSNLVAIQTPQVFKYDIIMKCHEDVKAKGIKVTDDTMVVESNNYPVYLYEGDYKNIKITTPEDLILGEYLCQ